MSSKARNLSSFISDPAIDASEIGSSAVTTDKIADLNVTHEKLHTDMDLSSKTVTFADNHISGNKIHGGVISDFASIGIDDNASATALTIDSSGNVGVGTSSPAGNSITNSRASGYTEIRTVSGANSTSIGQDENAGYVGTNTNLPLLAIVNGLERMRIDSSGNVGIGKTDPSTYVSNGIVIGGTNQNGYSTYTAQANDDTVGFINMYADIDQGYDRFLDIGVVASTSGAQGGIRFLTHPGSNDSIERMRIHWNGNVGIGTTSPTNKFEVDGGSAETRLRISTTGVDRYESGIILSNSSKSAFNDGVQITHGGGYTDFRDLAGTTIQTFDVTNNRVGIGTNSPTEELHIYDAENDPYVLVDGSSGNRDSGYKINAGDGVKIAVRANAVGQMFFADNAISVTGTIGNGQHRTVIVNSEIQLGGHPGAPNPSRAIVARLIEAKDLNSGYNILSSQSDTLSGYARRKNSGTGSSTFFFGPYGSFPAGQFTALFRLKINVVSSGSLGYIDVVGTGTTNPTGDNPRPRSQNLSTTSFSVDGQYQYFALDFDRTTNGGSIEFRWINANDNADCYVDHILVLPRLNYN